LRPHFSGSPSSALIVGVVGLYPDVLQNLLDVSAEGDDRNDAHLPTAVGADQWKHFVNMTWGAPSAWPTSGVATIAASCAKVVTAPRSGELGASTPH